MAISLGYDGRACFLDIGSATCSPVRRVRTKLVFLLLNIYILSSCFVHIGYYCDTLFVFMHIFYLVHVYILIEYMYLVYRGPHGRLAIWLNVLLPS